MEIEYIQVEEGKYDYIFRKTDRDIQELKRKTIVYRLIFAEDQKEEVHLNSLANGIKKNAGEAGARKTFAYIYRRALILKKSK